MNLWAITGKDGEIMISTISFLRKEAIVAFVKGSNMTWEECKKYGWRAIKVVVFPA